MKSQQSYKIDTIFDKLFSIVKEDNDKLISAINIIKTKVDSAIQKGYSCVDNVLN